MKKFTALFVTIFFVLTNTFLVSAQKLGQERLDSLLNELKIVEKDTDKINVLNALCFFNYTRKPDEGIKYGEQALELTKKINAKPAMSDVYSNIACCYFTKSDFPKALEYWTTSLKLREELGDKKRIMQVLGNMGNVYSSLFDSEKALEYYFKSLEMMRELRLHNEQLLLGNIGEVYYYDKDYTKALSYFKQALRLYEADKDSSGIAYTLGNIGRSFNQQHNYTEALEYCTKALTINERIGDNYYKAENYGSVASIYLMMVTDSNQEHLQKLFAGNRTEALKRAEIFADSSVSLNKELGNLQYLYEEYKKLSAIQELLGNKAEALKNYKRYSDIKDSVFNNSKTKSIAEIEVLYNQEKADAIRKLEDKRQATVRNGFILGFAVMLIFAVVFFFQRNRIAKEQKQSEELLLNILPAETATELKQTGTAKAKDFEQVTVLFTDFKNFTRMSEQLTAQELINEINYCYSAFDNIVAKYNIEKIKTIGDSYMCAGGLPVANKTNAEDTVRAALEMRDFVLHEKQKREADGKLFFEVRIGCNTGPVVAGIVGIKKFAYDIWGDTVNIASRMESSGEPGKVNISGSTYELVKDKFACTYRGKIEAKNKGMVDMYFVEEKN